MMLVAIYAIQITLVRKHQCNVFGFLLGNEPLAHFLPFFLHLTAQFSAQEFEQSMQPKN
jgi:hypothetical protein